MSYVKLLLVSLTSIVAASAFAEVGMLRLSMSPGLSVADGRSTVTVSAEVRGSDGRAAADGTQVVFATTLGNFREELVPVYGGYARAVLVASSEPGIAKITASAISMNATDLKEFEFVASRALLSAASEYIELEGPQSLMYNVDFRTMQASGPNQGAVMRYRDVEIRADDIQVNVPLSEVRARKAYVRIGKTEGQFEEIYFALRNRKGFGTTTFTDSSGVLVPFMNTVRFEPRERRSFGMAEIRATGITPPTEQIDPQRLAFEDLSEATSMIYAKAAVAFPRKEIQFHRAEVIVAGSRIMRVPLYNLSMSSSVLVTEQIVGVQNNKVAVNFPYYLSLKPGFSSLFRFRTGESYGRGFNSSSGAFLDYEMTWNRGDTMDGGFTVAGIGRNDMGFGIRQSYRPDDRTNAFIQGDLSEGRSLFGALSISRSFPGVSAGVSANSNHSITGIPYSNDSISFNIEKDPTKLGKLPVRFFYGLTALASESSTASYRASQSGFGFRTRMQMMPQRLDRKTSLSASVSATSLVGRNTNGGLGVLGTASMSRSLFDGATAIVGYDFADDGFSSKLLGHHRLNLQLFYGAGRFNFAGIAQRSLDIERSNYLVDASFRMSDIWRMSCFYTEDSYLGQSFKDYNFVLSYRLGIRDVGLVYSGTTNRFGIQILGAAFN
jgi:hypothetical protein